MGTLGNVISACWGYRRLLLKDMQNLIFPRWRRKSESPSYLFFVVVSANGLSVDSASRPADHPLIFHLLVLPWSCSLLSFALIVLRNWFRLCHLTVIFLVVAISLKSHQVSWLFPLEYSGSFHVPVAMLLFLGLFFPWALCNCLVHHMCICD